MVDKATTLTLQGSADGSPWCNVVVGTADPNTLELSADGSPWHGVADTGAPAGEIARISGVLLANIGKVANIAIGSIYKVGGKIK
jgi:hypothetical protein